MSSPPQQGRSSSDAKKNTPPTTSMVTRNGARKAKIQTRAMSAGAKPSAALLAAKKKGQQKKKQSVDKDTVVKDHYQIAMELKSKVRGATGLVTDPRMTEHCCLWDSNYPECPERLTCVIERCKELKLIDRCQQIPSRPATRHQLNDLHSPLVFELMSQTHQNHDVELLEEISSKFDAIYIHPSTHELALLAAGSTIDLVENVVKGNLQNGMALVRPPGHHAMRAELCGYCIYNNVALAAKHAVDRLGLNRVLIVDWDVHHGQGTQQMFYDEPRVLYFSVHRYEHGGFWPNLRQSEYDYVGAGPGRGYNVNVPLNTVGLGDADYLAVWHHLLLPMAIEFQPELVLVSAGYDAALGCPEGEMEVSPACYATLTHLLLCVTPHLVVVLEGGYCLPSLAEGAALTLRTLLGDPPPALPPLKEPSHSIVDSILNCIYVHKPYWKCHSHQPVYDADTADTDLATRGRHRVAALWRGDETVPDRYETRNCYPVQDKELKMELERRLNTLRIVTELSVAEHSVGYVYDEAMLKHRNIFEPGHVERPERVMGVHERHREYGLMDRVHRLPVRAADDEEILTVHTEDHLHRLKELSGMRPRELHGHKEAYDSVYFHPESLESARVAAGSVLRAVDAVVGREVGAAVCVVRPPGHHAGPDAPSGFCLLNNAALGAERAVRDHRLRRVLLLDWDVHHGNGTQEVFYSRPEVLYVSLHRYDHGTFFPHSPAGDCDRVGSARGEGHNINIPWNKRGMGDAEYLAAFTRVVIPVALEYSPELVIVSAGFDACIGDPLGGCKVTPECYGRMTQMLRSLAGGRVVLCLEGGYNVTSVSYAMTLCTKALLGDPLPPALAAPCHPSALETIDDVIRMHERYWKSLKFRVALPSGSPTEPPPPSRGCVYSEAEGNLTIDGERLSETLSNTLNRSSETSLERGLGNLTLEPTQPKCVDGHCGTDDEDDNDQCCSCEKTDQGKDVSNDNQQTCACENTDKGKDDLNKNGKQNVSDENGQCCSCKKMDERKHDPDEDGKQNCGCDKMEKGKDDPHKDGKHNVSDEKDQGCSDQGWSSRDAEGKMTLVAYLGENMQSIVDGEMFAVIPLPWCPHLEELYAVPEEVHFQQGSKCVDCDHTLENWVCLHCYVIACARGVNGHMQEHYRSTGHPLVLSLCDLSVWCNECDAYVDHQLLYDAKNNAHRHKFGETMPWCYPDGLQRHHQ